jgi:formate-dependent nitrite reductase membrane component NrfD
LFALLSFLAARGVGGGKLAVLRPPGPLGSVVTVLGGFFGAFLAGYTGVLLSVTNRPIWADTNLLGLVFLVSGASTAAAVLMLLGRREAGAMESQAALARFDGWMLVLELVVLVGLVASLGVVARAWLNAWGALLVVGVVGVGILAPLVLHRRHVASQAALASVLVLIGGFLLRVVVIFSSEGI